MKLLISPSRKQNCNLWWMMAAIYWKKVVVCKECRWFWSVIAHTPENLIPTIHSDYNYWYYLQGSGLVLNFIFSLSESETKCSSPLVIGKWEWHRKQRKRVDTVQYWFRLELKARHVFLDKRTCQWHWVVGCSTQGCLSWISTLRAE